MATSNGNIFRVTGRLCGEFTGHRWIPLTKASDAELWYFLWSRLNKRLSKQSWGWWFDTPSRSLWRHCNMVDCSTVSDFGAWPIATKMQAVQVGTASTIESGLSYNPREVIFPITKLLLYSVTCYLSQNIKIFSCQYPYLVICFLMRVTNMLLFAYHLHLSNHM